MMKPDNIACPYGGEAMTDHAAALERGSEAIEGAQKALVKTAMSMDMDARNAFCDLLEQRGFGGAVIAVKAEIQRTAERKHFEALLAEQRLEGRRPLDPHYFSPWGLGGGGAIGNFVPQRTEFHGNLASQLLARLGL